MAPKVERLDSEEYVSGIDRSGMLRLVGQTAEMIAHAEKLSSVFLPDEQTQAAQVVVVGMGGSAIAGDIACDLFAKRMKAPLMTLRGYSLPAYVGRETLLVALSYSGNTEETLSAVREAGKAGARIVCVTSGGKLKGIAESKKYPLCLIPSGYQPRAALPYLLLPLLKALKGAGAAPSVDDEVKESIGLLQMLKEEWGPARALRSNPVKQLAKKMEGRIPVIFGSSGTTAAAALRIKTQLNENSKMTAIVNIFPELNHNEIVNLSRSKKEAHKFSLLILRDEDDHERIKKRIEITKSLISRQMGGASEFASRGKSQLARILSLIFFGDYLSVYLALLQGIDPTAVDVISRLKKELSR